MYHGMVVICPGILAVENVAAAVNFPEGNPIKTFGGKIFRKLDRFATIGKNSLSYKTRDLLPLGRKCLKVTNALAYSAQTSLADPKSFMTLAADRPQRPRSRKVVFPRGTFVTRRLQSGKHVRRVI